MQQLAIKFIQLYRLLLSPWIGQQCRFYPSCSVYTEEAIQQHGVLKGSLLGAWRILRCTPWANPGLDPVPEKNTVCHCTDHTQGISK